MMRGAPWSQFNFNLTGPAQRQRELQPGRGADSFAAQPGNCTTALYRAAGPPAHRRQHLSARSQSRRGQRRIRLRGADHAQRGELPIYASISARLVAEYDSTLANPAETSLLRSKEFASQALLTWLPHPGTAVYIGYSNDMQNLDRSLCNRLPGGACDPNNTTPPRAGSMLNDGRQIFIKASYLFRF